MPRLLNTNPICVPGIVLGLLLSLVAIFAIIVPDNSIEAESFPASDWYETGCDS